MAGVESPPFALQNASHGAQLFRLAASAFLGALQPVVLTSPLYGNPSGSSYAIGSQTTAGHVGGVVGPGDFNITQNGSPNMSVNVAAGQIYIPGGSAAEQALYYGLSDATVNLTIAASNPTNPRIDTIVAYVEDASYSGSNNDWNLGVVTGTATAGATLSNLSGAGSLAGFPNCVVLGFVLVPANASSIVTADILNSQPLASPGFSGFLQTGTPSGRLFPTGGTSLVNVTTTQVTLAGTTFLKGGVTKSGNGLVVPVSGYYQISAGVGASGGTSAGTLACMIKVNGSLYSESAIPYNTNGVVATTSDIAFVAAGQSITLDAVQTSGGTITTFSVTTLGWLSAVLISR